MSVKIRLARGGAKKKPFYRVVVANSTAPRDGSFIEKLGYYNPLLADNLKIVLKNDRVEHWLSQGAEPTDRVLGFIKNAGINLPAKMQRKYELSLTQRRPKASKKEQVEG